jgi:hypothetical protein
MLLCASGLAALSAVGCANTDADGDGSDESAMNDASEVGAQSQTLTAANPNQTFYADVTANGSGCPAGTWSTSISEDGTAFTTTFSEYAAEIDLKQVFATKNCQLAVKLHTPNGLSVAVNHFSYQGFASLGDHVTGKASVKYYWQGQPSPDIKNGTFNFAAGFDSEFIRQQNVTTADLVFSPCGTVRDLNVATRLELRKPKTREEFGHLDMSAVDGEVTFQLGFVFQTCI